MVPGFPINKKTIIVMVQNIGCLQFKSVFYHKVFVPYHSMASACWIVNIVLNYSTLLRSLGK